MKLAAALLLSLFVGLYLLRQGARRLSALVTWGGLTLIALAIAGVYIPRML